MDIQKKLLDLRDDADVALKASKNLRTDAAKAEAAFNKWWGAKAACDAFRAELLKFGPPIEPHIVEDIVERSLTSLSDSGALGA